MKTLSKNDLWAAGVLLLLLLVQQVWAQSGGGYNPGWSSIDAGAGISSGGEFTLRGTVGQPDTDRLTGGSYTLAGGFWGQPVPIGAVISPPDAPPPRNYYIIRQVTLTWTPVSSATAYQVQVSRNTAFTSVVYTSLELSPDTVFHTIPQALDNNIYYWHVRAKDRTGKWGAWSVYDSFMVNAP